jgi:hypothetical protein
VTESLENTHTQQMKLFFIGEVNNGNSGNKTAKIVVTAPQGPLEAASLGSGNSRNTISSSQYTSNEKICSRQC